MNSRWILALSLLTVSAAGCCGAGNCGSCGIGGCGVTDCGVAPKTPFCRTYEERIAGGNAACGTCATSVGCCNGGIKGWLHNNATCCRGCGDVYWGEWTSDPPDCCDPCDQCGNFTGSGGLCCRQSCLPNLRRLFQSHRYCPGECGGGCGPSCGDCGGSGCASCGGGVGYHSHGIHGAMQPGSVLDENWDPAPAPKPKPGVPIEKADSPHRGRVSTARKPVGVQPASYQQWR